MFLKIFVFIAIAVFCHVSANFHRERVFSQEPIVVQPDVFPQANIQNYEEQNRRKYVENADVDNFEANPEYYAHPKYNFKYGVDDKHTGDKKFHYEERDGDVVRGQYKVLDPDGNIRIVDYTADKINGFNPVVSRKEYHPVV